MGVILDDIVRALFPEHAQPGHTVKMDPRPIVGPQQPDGWSCTCGHRDVLMPDEIRNALQEDLVPRT